MKQKTIHGFLYIKSSNTRRKVLLALADNILMPSEISKIINVSPPQTSRVLRDLE
ncbi:MAG: winged helix-turn-helix domain-containing protein, partial [Methanobacteriaceae archaeon]